MENGEWRMENGEWRMENREWGMGNGEWRMENGEWRMENEEWGMGNGEWGMAGDLYPEPPYQLYPWVNPVPYLFILELRYVGELFNFPQKHADICITP